MIISARASRTVGSRFVIFSKLKKYCMKKAIIILAALLMVSVAANVALWTEATKPGEVKVETRTEYIEMRDTTPNEIE